MISNVICFIFGSVGVFAIGAVMKIVGEFVYEGSSETFLKIGGMLKDIAVVFGAEKEYAPRHAYVKKGEESDD